MEGRHSRPSRLTYPRLRCHPERSEGPMCLAPMPAFPNPEVHPVNCRFAANRHSHLSAVTGSIGEARRTGHAKVTEPSIMVVTPIKMIGSLPTVRLRSAFCPMLGKQCLNPAQTIQMRCHQPRCHAGEAKHLCICVTSRQFQIALEWDSRWSSGSRFSVPLNSTAMSSSAKRRTYVFRPHAEGWLPNVKYCFKTSLLP
jgi:hypothetical protein